MCSIYVFCNSFFKRLSYKEPFTNIYNALNVPQKHQYNMIMKMKEYFKPIPRELKTKPNHFRQNFIIIMSPNVLKSNRTNEFYNFKMF